MPFSARCFVPRLPARLFMILMFMRCRKLGGSAINLNDPSLSDANARNTSRRRNPEISVYHGRNRVGGGGWGSAWGAGHKLRRSVQGRPLIVWAVEGACEAGLDDVYVVTGAEDLSDLLPPEVTVIQNHDWERGQGSSLRAGISVAGRDGHGAVVVGLGDMPFVTSAAWQAVAAAPGEIVTNTYLGKRRPPVKLAAEVWPLLPLFDDDEGARGLMRRRLSWFRR